MAFNRLATDANYNSIRLRKDLELIAKRTGLCCAARTIVFRIKINNQVLFTKERIDVEQISVLIMRCKCRNAASDFDFVHIIFLTKG